MNIKIIFILGTRYLLSKRYKKLPSIPTLLSFLGIFLGITSLVVVTSIMNGFQDEFTRQVIGMDPHIELYKYNNSLVDNHVLKSVKKIKSHQNVLFMNESISKETMLSFNQVNNILFTKGSSYDVIRSKKVKFSNTFTEKDFNNYGIILGKSLVEKISANVGDSVDIIVPEFSETMFGLIPTVKKFKIISTFDSGIYHYDNNIGFISLLNAHTLFNLDSNESNFEIYLKNPNNLSSIYNFIQNENQITKSYYVTNWKLANSTIINGLKMQKNVLLIVLSLFVMIAILGITTNLILLVNDKVKNIGILRSMGVSRAEIGLSFLVSSCIISILAILLGNILGIFIAANIDNIRIFFENILNVKIIDENLYLLSFLPSKIDAGVNFRLSILSFIASICASLIPSLKAARMNVSESLKI